MNDNLAIFAHDAYVDACMERDMQEARAKVLEDALRYIEYVWNEGYDGNLCPSCGMDDSVPHDRSCRTGNALAGQL